MDASVAAKPEVHGTGIPGITIALIGDPVNIEEAQVRAIVGGESASGTDTARAMIALLDTVVPSLGDSRLWLKPHMERAIKEGTDTTLESGRMISIIVAPQSKVFLLSVRATQMK